MRQLPEAVFGNAITSRIDEERVRIISIRSRPSASPPCGGAPKRKASSRKPNFAFASSGPMPSVEKTFDWTSGWWIRIDPPPSSIPFRTTS